MQFDNSGDAEQQLVDLDSSGERLLSGHVPLRQTSGAHVQPSCLGQQEREASGLCNRTSTVSSQLLDHLCTQKHTTKENLPEVGPEW